MNIIEEALSKGHSALTEYESKRFLSAYGIPVTDEVLVRNRKDLVSAIEKIGFPIVMKGCSRDILHKTEDGLIWLDVKEETEALMAYEHIMERMVGAGGHVLVQQMVKGTRELMVGMTREPGFGPCVMFGLGGVLTEVLDDTVCRVAPLDREDAFEMMVEIRGRKILENIRGMDRVDKIKLADILVSVGRIGMENEGVKEMDINPVIISGDQPIAVDALVLLERI